MKGYFIIEDENNNLGFKLASDVEGDVPEEQQDLLIDISNTLASIKLLFKGNESFIKSHHEQLAGIARVGLLAVEGEVAQPKLAQKALIQFKNEIVRQEGGKVKNTYLKKLGFYALMLSVIPIFLWFFYNALKIENELLPELKYVLLLWCGCMLGVWLSFGIRKQVMTFSDLIILEKDRLEPAIRLIFTGSISIVFSLLFLVDFVNVEIGSFSTINVFKSEATAILVGVLIGLSEQTIGLKLSSKSSTFIENL